MNLPAGYFIGRFYLALVIATKTLPTWSIRATGKNEKISTIPFLVLSFCGGACKTGLFLVTSSSSVRFTGRNKYFETSHGLLWNPYAASPHFRSCSCNMISPNLILNIWVKKIKLNSFCNEGNKLNRRCVYHAFPLRATAKRQLLCNHIFCKFINQASRRYLLNSIRKFILVFQRYFRTAWDRFKSVLRHLR